MPRKKVIVLAREYPPLPPGGVANFTESLFKKFHNTDITVYTQNDSWNELTFQLSDNISVVRTPLLSFNHIKMTPWYWPVFPRYIRMARYYSKYLFKRVLKDIRNEQIDHIYCNDLDTMPLAYRLFKATGIPYSSFIHGNTLLKALYSGEKTKKFYNKSMYNAFRIWANSKYTKSECEKYLVKNAIKVLPLGPCIPIEHIDSVKTAPRDGKVNLLTVGRLVERKNIIIVLHAIKQLKREDIHYRIVGSGPYHKTIEKMIKELGLEEKVTMLGYLTNDELEEVYGSSHIFIMPSKPIPPDDIEGFGIVYLEANAKGCPVIGGNSGGIPDAVEDYVNGLLVEYDSIDSVAKAISILADDEELCKQFVKNGIERIKNKYNWENAANIVMKDSSNKEA